MADGEADDVGLDLLERAQMAVGIVEGDAGAAESAASLRGAADGRAR
jgi:hypothetical protein